MLKTINPNWHVLFVHFPIALVSIGVLIELFAFLWRRSAVRTAARWMILIGALSAVPTITTGIYAFANAAKGSANAGGLARGDAEWADVVAHSIWGQEQWQFMRWHIILTCAATGAFLLVSIGYLAASDETRRKLYAPSLLLLLLGLGATTVGVWFSGEGVYRHRVAVMPAAQTDVPAGDELAAGEQEEPASPGQNHDMDSDEQGEHASAEHVTPLWSPNIQRFIPPLQVHTLLAGLAIAVALLSIGTLMRNWSANRPCAPAIVPTAGAVPQPGGVRNPMSPAMPGGNRPDVVGPGQPVRLQPPAASPPFARMPSGRFWLIALLLAICAGLSGLWFSEQGNWHFPEMYSVFQKWFSHESTTDSQRMAIHAVLGGGIVILTLLLGIFARFGRRARVIPLILLLLLVVAVGLQIWMGVLLMYRLKPTFL